MSRIYVVCPAEFISGGPELLHQLVDTLNTLGAAASIVYHPFDASHEVPAPYAKYDTPVARLSDLSPGDRVVLPESMTELFCCFQGMKVYLWWLSVDKFYEKVPQPFYDRVSRRIFGTRLLPALRLRELRHAHSHLHQSEYARLFLARHGLEPRFRLGDYLNEEYLSAIVSPPQQPRENILVYNPLKGREQTERVLERLRQEGRTSLKIIPIMDMSREQVRSLLACAKVYIDFGNHPGKDRIPREAAAMGMVVIVNRRGSAANDVDVPVPDSYKVDDDHLGFEAEATAKIASVVSDFPSHAAAFDSYRNKIAAERDEFFGDAASIFLK